MGSKVSLNAAKVPAKMGTAEVYVFSSRTRENVRHYVLVFPNKATICTCEGYVYNHACWHVDDLRTRLKLDT